MIYKTKLNTVALSILHFIYYEGVLIKAMKRNLILISGIILFSVLSHPASSKESLDESLSSLPPKEKAWIQAARFYLNWSEWESYRQMKAHQFEHFQRSFYFNKRPSSIPTPNAFRSRFENRLEKIQSYSWSLEMSFNRKQRKRTKKRKASDLYLTEYKDIEFDERTKYYLQSLERPEVHHLECEKKITLFEFPKTDGSEYLIFVPHMGKYRLWRPSLGLETLVNISHENSSVTGNPFPSNTAEVETRWHNPFQSNLLFENIAYKIKASCKNTDAKHLIGLALHNYEQRGLFKGQLQNNLPEIMTAENRLETQTIELSENTGTKTIEVVDFTCPQMAHFTPKAYNWKTDLHNSYINTNMTKTSFGVSVPIEDIEPRAIGELEAYNLSVCMQVIKNNQSHGPSKTTQFNVPLDSVVDNKFYILFDTQLRPSDYDVYIQIYDEGSQTVREFIKNITVPKMNREENLPHSGKNTTDQNHPRYRLHTSTVDIPDHESETPIKENAQQIHNKWANSLQLVSVPEKFYISNESITYTCHSDAPLSQIRVVINGKHHHTINNITCPYGRILMDFGNLLVPHEIEVLGLNIAEEIISRDIALFNTKLRNRNIIEIISPQKNQFFQNSFPVEFNLFYPEPNRIKKVELLWNEEVIWASDNIDRLPLSIKRNVNLEHEREVGALTVAVTRNDGRVFEKTLVVNSLLSDEVSVENIELFASLKPKHKGTNIENIHFITREDGEEQSIIDIAPLTEIPINFGLILDASSSMAPNMSTVFDASVEFFNWGLNRFTQKQNNRGFLIHFHEIVDNTVFPTTSIEDLYRGLSKISNRGQTKLYDAIAQGIYEAAQISYPTILIVISDGQDSQINSDGTLNPNYGSKIQYETLLQLVEQSHVRIYPISVNSLERANSPLHTERLDEIVHVNGTQRYNLSSINDLNTIFKNIQDDLRNTWLTVYQGEATLEKGAHLRRVDVEYTLDGSTYHKARSRKRILR